MFWSSDRLSHRTTLWTQGLLFWPQKKTLFLFSSPLEERSSIISTADHLLAPMTPGPKTFSSPHHASRNATSRHATFHVHTHCTNPNRITLVPPNPRSPQTQIANTHTPRDTQHQTRDIPKTRQMRATAPLK